MVTLGIAKGTLQFTDRFIRHRSVGQYHTSVRIKNEILATAHMIMMSFFFFLFLFQWISHAVSAYQVMRYEHQMAGQKAVETEKMHTISGISSLFVQMRYQTKQFKMNKKSTLICILTY